MQNAFGTVLWIVCGLGIVLAFLALARSGKTWEDYGKNRLLSESELGGLPPAGSPAALHERDVEIRQLLEARNARLIRRGEEPIDIEQELNRLTAPAIDDELRGEIRDLVVARNHRRARSGKPPLDVEAEVEREITALQEP
jgi:hypothetical protein